MNTFRSTLRLATCLTIMSVSAPAYANNLFLLQLGVFSSEDAASSQFSQVMETNDKLLDGKRYISKQSRPMSGGDVTWRSLVGPYDNRKLASRACAELKDNGQDCFVVETAAIDIDEVDAGKEVAAKQDASAETPADDASSNESVPDEASSKKTTDSAWDWLSGDSDEETVSNENADSNKAEKSSSASNSNININTHSVYTEAEAEPAPAVEIGLADSIASLFGGSEDSKEETVSDNEDKATESASNISEATETAEAEEAKEQTIEPTATRSGEVEIAEAIPVPLTEPEDVPVTQSAPAELAPIEKTEEVEATQAPEPAAEPEEFASKAETKVEPVISAIPPEQNPEPIREAAPRRIPLSEYQRETSTSRMLQVSVFENDRLAFQCLNNLQGTIPAASMLRSRIIKSTSGQAVVRLGPVNDAELETAICTSAVECGEQIQCRIISERDMRQPRRSRDSAGLLPTRDSRNPYAPMPRNLSPIPTSKPTASAASPVWVQLGTSNSENDARSKFETLQRIYPDLLKDYKPVINTPENQSFGGRVYRLRVGSFDSRQKAQSLCSALSSHGVGCLVLSK